MKQDLKLASGDYIVPAGTTVVVATYKLHRLASIYPNPDKFDPDNFLPERQANRHYYAFVPFSAGKLHLRVLLTGHKNYFHL